MGGIVTAGGGRARRIGVAGAGPRTYRRSMPDEAWGAIDLALITVGVVGAFWLIAHAADLLELSIRGARFLHLMKPLPPVPAGMPIERIAADLRRIRPQTLLPAAGTPMVRRKAIVAAYDEALLDACRALGVQTELDSVTDTFERESERLRTEAELERAGVSLG